jgi:hypothetical protein
MNPIPQHPQHPQFDAGLRAISAVREIRDRLTELIAKLLKPPSHESLIEGVQIVEMMNFLSGFSSDKLVIGNFGNWKAFHPTRVSDFESGDHSNAV